MSSSICMAISATTRLRFEVEYRVIWLVFILILPAHAALAYPPFDSTDADVGGQGEFELELGPIGSLREGQNKFWVAPAVIANFGLRGERELVLQGQRQSLREGAPETPSTSLVNTGIFIKQ